MGDQRKLRRLDNAFKQLANDALSMAKAHLMEFDKPRIAADINKHDEGFFISMELFLSVHLRDTRLF
jgi:hypothetical protein